MGGYPGMKRTPLSRVSKKRQKLLRQRSAFRKDILAANPYCVVCNDRFASDVHEPLTRARGGSILDPDNALGVCRGCHDWIHDHPEEATKRGLLRSQHD